MTNEQFWPFRSAGSKMVVALQSGKARLLEKDASGRWRRYAFVFCVLSLLAALLAPALVSHTPIGRILVARIAANHGLGLEVEQLQIGWFSNLRLSQVELHSNSGDNQYKVDQIDCNLTLATILDASAGGLENLVLRGVRIRCKLNREGISIADDFKGLSGNNDQSADRRKRRIQLQDVSLIAVDSDTGDRWQVSQLDAEIRLDARSVSSTVSGTVSAPTGRSGKLSCKWETRNDGTRITSTDKGSWQFRISGSTIPVAALKPISRHVRHLDNMFPGNLRADATGALQLSGNSKGSVTIKILDLELTDLLAVSKHRGEVLVDSKSIQVDGQLEITGQQVFVRALRADTEFGTLAFDGSVAQPILSERNWTYPGRWLEAVDGQLKAKLDVSALAGVAPGAVPPILDTESYCGSVTASVRSLAGRPRHRHQFSVRAQGLRSHMGEHSIELEPLILTGSLTSLHGKMAAEQIDFRSGFGTATATGDDSQSRLAFQLELDALKPALRPSFLSEAPVGGSLTGSLDWSWLKKNDPSEDAQWRLTGSVLAKDIAAEMRYGRTIKDLTSTIRVKAEGQWKDNSISNLAAAEFDIAGSDVDLTVRLAEPRSSPSLETTYPLEIEASGQLDKLLSIAPETLPAVNTVSGKIDIQMIGELSRHTGRLTRASIVWHPKLRTLSNWIHLGPEIDLDFDGQWIWPSGGFKADSLTLNGESISAVAQGEISSDNIDFSMHWTGSVGTELQRSLTRAGHTTVTAATSSQTLSKLSFIENQWQLFGDFIGDIEVKRDADQRIRAETRVFGTELSLALCQPHEANTSPSSKATAVSHSKEPTAVTSKVGDRQSTVWSEPRVSLTCVARYDTQTKIVEIGCQADGSWFTTMLNGRGNWQAADGAIALEGPLRMKTSQLASRLSDVGLVDVELSGVHETDLAIQLARRADRSMSTSVTGTLGWDAGQIAGLNVGPALIPLQFSDNVLHIGACEIPTAGGQVYPQCQVAFYPTPMTIQLHPGTLVRKVRLSSEVTEQWLKRIAPPLSEVRSLGGTFGVEIDSGRIVVGAMNQSRVAGRIVVEQAKIDVNPSLRRDLLAARKRAKGESQDGSMQTMPAGVVTLPAQTIPFRMKYGLIDQERIVMNLDDLQISTAGQVSLDGRVNMIATVPREPTSSDMPAEDLHLPVSGSIFQPRIDPAGIGNIALLLRSQLKNSHSFFVNLQSTFDDLTATRTPNTARAANGDMPAKPYRTDGTGADGGSLQ